MKDLHEIMPFQLIDAVCAYKGITKDDLKGKSRVRDVVVARYLVAYMFLYMGYRTTGIGDLINRNHSSVSHYKKILVSGLDAMINYDLRFFRLFLFERGVLLPQQAQFNERCPVRIYEK